MSIKPSLSIAIYVSNSSVNKSSIAFMLLISEKENETLSSVESLETTTLLTKVYDEEAARFVFWKINFVISTEEELIVSEKVKLMSSSVMLTL